MSRFVDQNVAWVVAMLVTVGSVAGAYYGVEYLYKKRINRLDQAISFEEANKSKYSNTEFADKRLDKDEIPGDLNISENKPIDSSKVRWGYSGDVAPKFWAKLHPDFALCGSGKKQSPIDLMSPEKSVKVPVLDFKYKNSSVRITNTGSMIRVEPEASDNILLIGKEPFTLRNIDFHAASEHKVDTLPFDMEIQFYHINAKGDIAAVSVFVSEGARNSSIQNVWNNFPSRDEFPKEGVKMNISSLIPRSKSYFHYMGSLTSPPCTEGVSWFVFDRPITISSKQIDDYVAFNKYNVRPIQPLFGRKIFKN